MFETKVKLVGFGSAIDDSAVYEVAEICRLSYGAGSFGDKTKSKRDSIEDDKRLIQHCFDSGHMSVFEFVDATVFIECPIFVARQLMRYRHASYLEQSCRRIEPSAMKDVYKPEDGCDERILEHDETSRELYKTLLEIGIRREIARAVLPVGTITRFFMKANMREWYHIFDERISRTAQKETRDTVMKVKDALNKVYPYFISLWDRKNYGSEILSSRSGSIGLNNAENNNG